jgi:hypothetical protein
MAGETSRSFSPFCGTEKGWYILKNVPQRVYAEPCSAPCLAFLSCIFSRFDCRTGPSRHRALKISRHQWRLFWSPRPCCRTCQRLAVLVLIFRWHLFGPLVRCLCRPSDFQPFQPVDSPHRGRPSRPP